MKLAMLPRARREMLRAARWYDRESQGLGDQLLDEIGASLQEIRDLPHAATKLDETYRRKLIGTFPYGLIYRLDDGHITIVAIMHLKRRPGYWRKRLKSDQT